MMRLPHSLCLKGWEIAQWRKQNVELIKHKADFFLKIEVMWTVFVIIYEKYVYQL